MRPTEETAIDEEHRVRLLAGPTALVSEIGAEDLEIIVGFDSHLAVDAQHFANFLRDQRLYFWSSNFTPMYMSLISG